jgi:hypothetical protein
MKIILAKTRQDYLNYVRERGFLDTVFFDRKEKVYGLQLSESDIYCVWGWDMNPFYTSEVLNLLSSRICK